MLRIRPPNRILLERDDELSRAAEVLEGAALRRSGGLLVIEGPPGIGKTTLLGEVRRLAAARGMRVLTGTGGELEQDFPYGVVRQLFEPLLRQADPSTRDELLDGAAARARVALESAGSVPSSASAEGPYPVLHGLYWLTSNVAERVPLLIILDDAQWADAASLAYVAFLIRRIGELPVALALSARSRESTEGDALLVRITSDRQAVRLRPGPLSHRATTELVRNWFSEAEEEFCRACHTATGGNPFLIQELVADLEAEGICATAAEAPRVERLVPEAVARAVLVRLVALPDSASRFARALTILGDDAELRHAGSLAGLGEQEAVAAADALVAVNIVSAGPPFSFVHPIVREVIYREASASERTVLHARAARVLYDSGISSERAAAHLMLSEPNAEGWRIPVLRRSAQEALQRGAPEVATAHLSRALAESPGDDLRAEVLCELGTAQTRAGDLGCVSTLRRALDLQAHAGDRAKIALQLAQVLSVAGDIAVAFEVLDETLSELGSAVDDELALRIEVELISTARLFPATRQQARQRLNRLRPRASPDSAAGALLLANLALDAVESGGRPDEVRELAGRAISNAGLLSEDSFAFSYAVNSLTWVDEYVPARQAWDQALLEARERRSPITFGLASSWRCHLAYREGRIAEAEADGLVAHDIFTTTEIPVGVAYTAAFLADVLMETGKLTSSAALVADGDLASHSPFFLDTRARVRHLQRRFAEALEDFLACGEVLAGRGGRDSPAIISWRSGAALSLAALGKHDEAGRHAEEEIALARSQGTPRAVGIALRAAGLIEGGRAGLGRLRESVAALDGSPALLERARVLVDLGSALRRAGHRAEARHTLGRSMDLAHRCGAVLMEQRAREELLATGARPRRSVLTGYESLTASERRVVRMASEGMSNREIAQALFISTSTVASHLVRSYEKLGVAGRQELSEALAIHNQPEDDH